ncbi:transcription elongation factor GreA [Clostridium celatum DSM 1785]|uniref:Transcription elongation factor GreA n=2 Tax=Clostridium celatum TaxID=36834 RepID=L1QC44_9CLOT|nr:transcription elongation factor GreA [Clostridium celatum DSM 1785]
MFNKILNIVKFEGEKDMSQTKKFIMTYEGVKKLEEELEYLKTVKRKEITEKIKVALGYGDLSENSEYDEAKNDQAFTEGRIIQLENMLKNAVVVDESEIPKDKVSVGSIVKVMDYDFDEEVEYSIVGSAEADPMNFKISNESPVGSALLGKKVGDVVEVAVPNGVSKFEVLEIRRD